MSSNGLPPNFNLNLSQVVKNQIHEDSGELPPTPTNQNSSQTRSRTRQRPTRRNAPRNQKNLVLENSDSSSDIDLDEDLAQIPAGKEEATVEKEPETIPEQIAQINVLPDLEDDDDDDEGGKDKNKLSLLYDLLLTVDQCEEPEEQWNYKEFIKEYAKTEAQEDGSDFEEEDLDFDEEEDI